MDSCTTEPVAKRLCNAQRAGSSVVVVTQLFTAPCLNRAAPATTCGQYYTSPGAVLQLRLPSWLSARPPPPDRRKAAKQSRSSGLRSTGTLRRGRWKWARQPGRQDGGGSRLARAAQPQESARRTERKAAHGEGESTTAVRTCADEVFEDRPRRVRVPPGNLALEELVPQPQRPRALPRETARRHIAPGRLAPHAARTDSDRGPLRRRGRGGPAPAQPGRFREWI